ncbi:LysR family transcriptional regulator [Sphingopyxis sp. JAI108]|uniref:LysR family transcriptional regulator n=1 Tax=Sphingopyxis sp. JAI108 TaxID=2723060 RepID=UPI0015C7E264|nr:LysR family transcriptional regulator [Sphingopyxis sp. JAI108]NYF33483.1 DNA-binding transcriptional LysR family regulator [Sphingopyxis sp. JAI108]
MPDWEHLKHFAALATGGTLTAAARELGVDHATVARRIAALEQELGARLVDRRGRRLTLTLAGEQVAAMAAQMAAQAVAIERTASGERSEVAGQVTVSAPPAFAAAMLADPIVRLRDEHPDLLICILGETHYSSLSQREADIAIRFGRPTAGDITAVKVGVVIFHVYGRADYLVNTAVSDRSFIGYDEALDAAPQQVALRRLAGETPLALRSNTIELQMALARAGGGVVLAPDFLAAPDPQLVRATDDEIIRREVWLTFHTDLKGSAPVRAVANCLREALSRDLRRLE